MFNLKTLAVASLMAIVAVGCSKDEQQMVHPGMDSNANAKLSVDKTKMHEKAARKLAKSLSNPQLRSFIKAEVLKKFDGDYDVLFSTVKRFTQSRALTNVDLNSEELAASEQLPLLNIAVPVHAEKWNTESFTPLVAYLPEDYDEATVTEITAYDANGKAHTLSTKKAPDVPVIIIGQNERAEIKAGQVTLKQGLIDINKAKSARVATVGKVCGLAPYNKMLYLVGIRCENVQAIEDYVLGAPEIRMNLYYADQSRNANQIFYGDGRGNLWEPPRRGDVDQNWWMFRDKLARWAESYGDIINFTYWEEDSGDTKPQPITIKGKYKGVEIEISTTVHIRNRDEYIGTFQVDRDFCTNSFDSPFGNQSLKFAIDHDDY